MNQNFQNQAFRDVFETITRNMPQLIFFGIIVTYIVTAALNVHTIPLPLALSVPASIMIQFGRFAVVFMDFLNPTGVRSKWPPIIASVATVAALIELGFSIQDIQITEGWNAARYWSVYLFGAMLISFGYILELNFIAKGAEAYGMNKQPVIQNVTQIPFEVTNPNFEQYNTVTVAEKRPEVLRELRERQTAKATASSEGIGYQLRRQKASLRAYRHKLLNNIGNESTNLAGIKRAEDEIARLKELS